MNNYGLMLLASKGVHVHDYNMSHLIKHPCYILDNLGHFANSRTSAYSLTKKKRPIKKHDASLG